MIADMLSNKELNPIGTELFIREKKLNISLASIYQSHFAVPKSIKFNTLFCYKNSKQKKALTHCI